MTLREAQDTVMPWGVHHRQMLGAIWINDRTYLTVFLRERIDSLDSWLREAVEIVIAEGESAKMGEDGQGEIFGSDDGGGKQSTGEKQ